MKTSTATSSMRGITCRNDITLIHVPHGQKSFDDAYAPIYCLLTLFAEIDKKDMDPTCFEKTTPLLPGTYSKKKQNQRPIPPASVLLAPFLHSKNAK